MKTVSFNKLLVTMVILAAAPYAQSSTLAQSELESVRGVLRAMNFDESQLSNEDLEVLRSKRETISSYEKSKAEFLMKVYAGEIHRTCGAGSHGGDGDPV